MKIKALVTMFVLGTSSLALAAPYGKPTPPAHGARFAPPPAIRDHRRPPRPIASWKLLASSKLTRGKAVVRLRVFGRGNGFRAGGSFNLLAL